MNLLVSFLTMLGILSVFMMITSCDKQAGSKKTRLIPMEDFFKNPQTATYRISPDGTHLSFLAPYGGRMNIFVQKVGEKDSVRITAEKDRDIAGYFWANNNRIVFLRDEGGDENNFLVAIDRDGTNEKALTKLDGVKTTIIDDLPDNEKEMIVGLNKRNAGIFDPYRIDIETGNMEMIIENPGNVTNWMTDHDGKLRIAVITDGINNRFLYRNTEEDEFEVFLETNFEDNFSPAAFTFDNQNLYAVSNLGRDKNAVVIFDLETGKEKEQLYQHDKYDLSGLDFSRKEKKLLSATYTSWKTEYHYFDDAAKKMGENIQAKTGKDFYIVANDKAEKTYIVYVYSDRSMGDYYVYRTDNSSLTHIADIAPWIDEQEMVPLTPIQYTSRDGMSLEGYLALPPGYTQENARNLPVVINPHGGPWARDDWGYNSEVQFLANRGYAVLSMNFRGSTGYGKAFWKASFKQWGLKMQDDISDGVKWLIDQGIADSARVGIYGGSYGGYATLAGLTFTPDLYACGVDYVGVSSLFTFMNSIPPYWKPYLDMIHRMVGDPGIQEDSLQMAKTSPSLHADKIKAPLLVVQGANDPRVKKSESDQMVEAMRKRGVEVEYMVKDNEGHGFRNEENRFDFYRAMERFLALHLGGRASVADKVADTP